MSDNLKYTTVPVAGDPDLYQLVASKTFKTPSGVLIEKGTKGGVVSSQDRQDCLSQEDSSWIHKGCQVVSSRIHNNSEIEGNVSISLSMVGASRVSGTLSIKTSCIVDTDINIQGRANISHSTLKTTTMSNKQGEWIEIHDGLLDYSTITGCSQILTGGSLNKATLKDRSVVMMGGSVSEACIKGNTWIRGKVSGADTVVGDEKEVIEINHNTLIAAGVHTRIPISVTGSVGTIGWAGGDLVHINGKSVVTFSEMREILIADKYTGDVLTPYRKFNGSRVVTLCSEYLKHLEYIERTLHSASDSVSRSNDKFQCLQFVNIEDDY